jgi:hypothetical protein
VQVPERRGHAHTRDVPGAAPARSGRAAGADRSVLQFVRPGAQQPAGRLAAQPGSHALPLELPDVVNPLLISFLRSE